MRKTEKQKEYDKQLKLEAKLDKMKEEMKRLESELMNQKYRVMKAED